MKVLVFTPIYSEKDYCLEEFIANCERIDYPNYKHIYIDNSKTLDYISKLQSMGLEAYHVERGNNSREALTRAQNFARNIAIKEGYDFIFSLESDIFCPNDIIQRLIIQGKSVISGLYMIGDRSKGMRHPCITIKKWNKMLNSFGTRLLTVKEAEELPESGLMRVAAGGMGCCLISKEVFTRFPFWFEPRLLGHSDIFFFNDMNNYKIPVYVDLSLYCEHKNSKWTDVKDR